MLKVFKIALFTLLAFILVFLGLFFYSIHTHVALDEEFQSWYDQVQEPSSDTAIYVQFIGVSSMVISDGKTTLMTDGFFSRPTGWQLLFGKIQPEVADIHWGVAKLELEQLDAIFTVHSHFDHAMDAPEVAKLTGARLFGSISTANIARGWGLPEDQIRTYQDYVPISIGAFRITPILSKHYQFPNTTLAEAALLGNQEISSPLVPPVKALDYKMGGAYGLLFEHPQGKFLLQSSAGVEVGNFEDLEVDKVILGVAGLSKQTEEYQETYFREVVDAVGAKTIIPIHWDAFVGSIRGPMQGPVMLNNQMMDINGSLRVIKREVQARGNIDVQLLPQWEKVMLFP